VSHISTFVSRRFEELHALSDLAALIATERAAGRL
jgi:hypothetical protein